MDRHHEFSSYLKNKMSPPTVDYGISKIWKVHGLLFESCCIS